MRIYTTSWNRGNRAYESVCLYCGSIIFASYPGRKYCNRKCFDNSMEKKITCGKNGKSLKGKAKKAYHESWGYKYIFVPNHPLSDRHGYVAEHRLMMEKYLGRYLTIEEIIHHKNGDKKDNRIENLQVITRSEHSRIHALERHKNL